MFELRAARIGLAVALITAAAPAAPVLAQDGDDVGTIARRWFERNDLDKDGYLTAAEIESGRAKQLRRIDIDGDGYITLDEYRFGLPRDRPVQAAWLEAQFAHMDADGDGLVSTEEFIGYGARLIADADADLDGRISLDEYLALTAQ